MKRKKINSAFLIILSVSIILFFFKKKNCNCQGDQTIPMISACLKSNNKNQLNCSLDILIHMCPRLTKNDVEYLFLNNLRFLINPEKFELEQSIFAYLSSDTDEYNEDKVDISEKATYAISLNYHFWEYLIIEAEKDENQNSYNQSCLQNAILQLAINQKIIISKGTYFNYLDNKCNLNSAVISKLKYDYENNSNTRNFE